MIEYVEFLNKIFTLKVFYIVAFGEVGLIGLTVLVFSSRYVSMLLKKNTVQQSNGIDNFQFSF